MTISRCKWCQGDELMMKYHDEEWGVECHDDNYLFELLILEGAQAGLSWKTVLHKRQNYRIAFDNFNATKIANYTDEKINQLMQNSGIIRNKLKIISTIKNAQAFLKIQNQFGSFDKYIWQFINHKPIKNIVESMMHLPTTTIQAQNMSKNLLKNGFKFVGPTICYAFMQGCGMVIDHEKTCFKA